MVLRFKGVSTMQPYLRFVTSKSCTRLFSALVIFSLVFSILPAFSPPAANAQEGGVATYIAEAYNCPSGFDPSAGDASTALANCVERAAGIPYTLGTQAPN